MYLVLSLHNPNCEGWPIVSNLASDVFYKHSGRMGLSVPAILIVGLPAIVLLSAIYAYIVAYCPIVGWVNAIFLGGYVMGGGIVLAILAKQSKCRNPGMLFWLGFVAGVVGLYSAWVFFVKALAGGEFSTISLATNPAALWGLISAINTNGWWGPSGMAQWALVSIEAIVIVGGIATVTAGAIDRDAFCEECGTWCDQFEKMHLKPTPEMLVTSLDKLNHMELLALDDADVTDYPRIDAEVLQCSGCKNTQAIRFKKLSQVQEEGGLKEKSEDIPNLLIQKK